MRKYFVICALTLAAITFLMGCNSSVSYEYPQYSEDTSEYDETLTETNEENKDIGQETQRPQGRAVDISVAHGHTLVLMEDGSLWGWGAGHASMFEPRGESSLYPTFIMDDVIFAVAGEYHSMAIKTDGGLWAWGDNFWGQIGDGTNLNRPSPVWVMDDVVYAAISPAMVSSHASGGARSYAIRSDGTLWAWGEGDGRYSPWGVVLGDGGNEDRLLPIQILENVASVTPTHNGGQAITLDGRLWHWHPNIYGSSVITGELWLETPAQLSPAVVDEIPSLRRRAHFRLDENGTLWAWGENRLPDHWRDGPILGDGTTIDRDEPVVILENVTYFTIAGNTVYALTADGVLWAWGNLYGAYIGNGSQFDGAAIWEGWEQAYDENGIPQGGRWLLNDGDHGIVLSPVSILTNVVSVAASYYIFDHGWIIGLRGFAITEDGAVWAWGANTVHDTHGLLGDGTSENRPYPVQIIGN
ncbi:MAG: hypothetical protein FWE44_03470 [Defluviitaleaceae bacterium]|nr:hypothetical protein [Defluviitaleaceae bacterium]